MKMMLRHLEVGLMKIVLSCNSIDINFDDCPTPVLSNPPAYFKWPARVSLNFSNLCFKNDITD